MESNIYPKLESTDSHTFRMSHIKDIKLFFEREIESRRKTINKYKKVCTGLSFASNGCISVGVVCEATSIALIATGIAAVGGIILECVGLGIGLIAIPAGFGNKRVWKKLEKHEEIHVLAISKLNSINDLISKALEDGHIDGKEYKTILDEHEKYIGLKNLIRNKSLKENNNDLDVEKLKKEFTEIGKKMGKQEVLKLLKSEQ